MLVPKDVDYPLGLVHFVGGQGVGVFPRNAYGALLEALVDAGAAPFFGVTQMSVTFLRCVLRLFALRERKGGSLQSCQSALCPSLRYSSPSLCVVSFFEWLQLINGPCGCVLPAQPSNDV